MRLRKLHCVTLCLVHEALQILPEAPCGQLHSSCSLHYYGILGPSMQQNSPYAAREVGVSLPWAAPGFIAAQNREGAQVALTPLFPHGSACVYCVSWSYRTQYHPVVLKHSLSCSSSSTLLFLSFLSRKTGQIIPVFLTGLLQELTSLW